MPPCYQYVYIPNRRHPATVAYNVSEEVEGGEPIVRVTLGISFCNNKDQFKKVLGRKIAEGRLAKSAIEFSYKYNREENSCFGKTLSREVANFVRSNSFGLSLQVSQQ